MSDSSTVMVGALKPRLRHMSKHELPDGLQTNRRTRGLGGVDEPPEGRLRQRIGWVAEVQGRMVGPWFTPWFGRWRSPPARIRSEA